jgi:uncharacterized membrane protein YeiH
VLVYSSQAYPHLYFIAVLMGVITGCFGGIIRDVIGNRVPTVFHRSPLYATCATTFVIRMLAVRFNISLPL